MQIVDGFCHQCVIRRNEAEENDLLAEFSEEQTEVATLSFWIRMKKLFDIKFSHFTTTIEMNLQQKLMQEVRVQVDAENKHLKADIETLKEENAENEGKLRHLKEMCKI